MSIGKIHLYRAEKYLKFVTAREREQLAIKEIELFKALQANTAKARSELFTMSLEGSELSSPHLPLHLQCVPRISSEVALHSDISQNHHLFDIKESNNNHSVKHATNSDEPTNFITHREATSNSSGVHPWSHHRLTDLTGSSVKGESSRRELTSGQINCATTKDDTWRYFE